MQDEYINQLKIQLNSFVEALATAIDERTPYNGNHTRKVAEYALMIAKKINEKYMNGDTKEYFDEERLEKLRLAALVHDIGKMVISKSIMNRSTRLDGDIDNILIRFKLIESWYEIDYLKGNITKEQFESHKAEMKKIISFIQEIDGIEYLSDELYLKVQQLRFKVYIGSDGREESYFTEDEIEHLSIRRGTLTENERDLMQSHVEMTMKILSKVEFSDVYSQVPVWAGQHHEFLDGSGYPNHLTAKDLSLETRILTVSDIYDALTATDRPYKKPMSVDYALSIMNGMVKKGKLDSAIVKLLSEILEDNK